MWNSLNPSYSGVILNDITGILQHLHLGNGWEVVTAGQNTEVHLKLLLELVTLRHLVTSCDILWPFMATSCRTGKNLEESTWINISIHFCDWRVMKCRGVLFREAAKHSKLLILADRTASFHSYGLFIFKNFIYLELESKIYVQISILDGCTVKQQVFEAWSYVSFESNGSWLVKSFRFVGPDKLGPATNSSCEKWSCARISGSRISFEDGSGGAQAAI